jgi:polar amino acid transport system substrate-binding protein
MKPYLLSGLIAALVTLLVLWGAPPARDTSTHHESAYDRVIRTSVLRCAYGVWEPAVMHDPNTGEFSGLIYDLMQEVGKSLNIKVEYTLDTPWESIATELHTGKADAHCAGIFATPARGRMMAFSTPLFFSPTVAFARSDDTRFDKDLSLINDPKITVALSDDDITTEIYAHDFPLAQKYNLPQFAPPEELFLAIMTKKADVTFNGPTRLKTFNQSYPNSIKIIPTPRPLRIFPNTIAVDIGEEKLLHMINTAIDQLHDSGTIDKLIAQYKKNYDMDFLVRVTRPYSWGQ